MLLAAAAFLIAPVWQFGYAPVPYEQPAASEFIEDQPQCVNINTAGEEELQRLSGVGPAKAAAILAFREEHGPFDSVNELTEVPGISARMVEEWLEEGTACAEVP